LSILDCLKLVLDIDGVLVDFTGLLWPHLAAPVMVGMQCVRDVFVYEMDARARCVCL